jgi:hypothetical protein
MNRRLAVAAYKILKLHGERVRLYDHEQETLHLKTGKIERDFSYTDVKGMPLPVRRKINDQPDGAFVDVGDRDFVLQKTDKLKQRSVIVYKNRRFEVVDWEDYGNVLIVRTRSLDAAVTPSGLANE